MIDLVENTADITDQNDKNKQSIEHIVYYIETRPYDISLEPIMKNLDFVYFCQVNQFQQTSK